MTYDAETGLPVLPNVVRFERRTREDTRNDFRRSLEHLDGAELLRLAAIQLRHSADDLDRLANDLDPFPSDQAEES